VYTNYSHGCTSHKLGIIFVCLHDLLQHYVVSIDFWQYEVFNSLVYFTPFNADAAMSRRTVDHLTLFLGILADRSVTSTECTYTCARNWRYSSHKRGRMAVDTISWPNYHGNYVAGLRVELTTHASIWTIDLSTWIGRLPLLSSDLLNRFFFSKKSLL